MDLLALLHIMRTNTFHTYFNVYYASCREAKAKAGNYKLFDIYCSLLCMAMLCSRACTRGAQTACD